jgi:hypothetical protein
MWKGKQAEQQNVRIANDIPYFMLLLISVGWADPLPLHFYGQLL